ncbi:MAG: hypothetical protein AAGC85_10020 [Bacteroidota bacterium]
MLKKVFLGLILGTLTFSLFSQSTQKQRIYKIQLLVYYEQAAGVLNPLATILSPADFAAIKNLGVIEETEGYRVLPDGTMMVNFRRITLGHYADQASAVYVWQKVRAIGEKYVGQLELNRAFIYCEPNYWANKANGWVSHSIKGPRYTVQLASLKNVNADALAPFIDTFENVFFERSGGNFKVYVGLFDQQQGAEQSQILAAAQQLGYKGAFVKTFQ